MAKLVLPSMGANAVTDRVEPLTIQLLGPIKVWRNGCPISEQEWTRKKLKQLLAVLLTEPGRVFTYDQLTEFLLAGTDPGKARRNLQSLMSRLRRISNPNPDGPPIQRLSSVVVKGTASTPRRHTHWIPTS